MENFNEFDVKASAPERSTSEIIAHAYENYKKVVVYGIVFFIIMIVISYVLSYIAGLVSGYNALDVQSMMRENPEKMSGFTGVFSIPGMKSYSALSFLLGLLVYPLYAGFLVILNKSNHQKPVEFSDLFIGYRQNTLQLIIYGLISNIIFGIGVVACVLPFFFIYPLLFIGLPIIVFEKKTAVEALSKSFNIAKANYGTFLGASLLALLIAIAGVILCGFGLIVTVPFLVAAMYSAYCAFCGVPQETLAD